MKKLFKRFWAVVLTIVLVTLFGGFIPIVLSILTGWSLLTSYCIGLLPGISLGLYFAWDLFKD